MLWLLWWFFVGELSIPLNEYAFSKAFDDAEPGDFLATNDGPAMVLCITSCGFLAPLVVLFLYVATRFMP